MTMFENWKYNNWKSKQVDRSDIEAYISYEIYPEDIEIFSKILYPDFMQHKNCIIRLPSDCTEQELDEIKILFESWENEKLSFEEIEKIMNYALVADIFFNTSMTSSFSTLESVATLIKFNWEIWLHKKFPDRKFNVVLLNDDGQLALTFFQQR